MDLGGLLGGAATGAATGSAGGPWGSIIGAGIGAASSLIGGQMQNQANREMAQNQMNFQDRMRSTSYQTAVADLKAAGLNPMLAYAQGGAAVPQGASAQMGNPLGEAGNSAREAARAIADIKQLDIQNFATEQQGEASASNAAYLKDQAALTRTQNAVELARMPGHGKFGAYVDAQMRSLNASANQANTNAAYIAATQPEANAIGKAYSDMPNLKKGERVVQAVSAGVNSAKGLRDMARPTPSKTYNFGVRQ